MTNKEIDKLAELIADKLIAKQKEYDEQFHIDLQETISDKLGNVRHVSEEELLLAELTSDSMHLKSYEKSEQFEKAAAIHGKIKHIEEKLNNL